MSALPLKKPKVETNDGDEVELQSKTTTNNMDNNSREEQEEALVALIEHRTHEVKHLRHRISYYKSQVASYMRAHTHILVIFTFFFFLSIISFVHSLGLKF